MGLRQAPARRWRRKGGDETLGFVFRVSALNGPCLTMGLNRSPLGLALFVQLEFAMLTSSCTCF